MCLTGGTLHRELAGQRGSELDVYWGLGWVPPGMDMEPNCRSGRDSGSDLQNVTVEYQERGWRGSFCIEI